MRASYPTTTVISCVLEPWANTHENRCRLHAIIEGWHVQSHTIVSHKRSCSAPSVRVKCKHNTRSCSMVHSGYFSEAPLFQLEVGWQDLEQYYDVWPEESDKYGLAYTGLVSHYLSPLELADRVIETYTMADPRDGALLHLQPISPWKWTAALYKKWDDQDYYTRGSMQYGFDYDSENEVELREAIVRLIETYANSASVKRQCVQQRKWCD